VAFKERAGVLEVLFGVGLRGGNAHKRFVEDADDPPLLGEGRYGDRDFLELSARSALRGFWAFQCERSFLARPRGPPPRLSLHLRCLRIRDKSATETVGRGTPLDTAGIPVFVLSGGRAGRRTEMAEFSPQQMVTIGPDPILSHTMKPWLLPIFRCSIPLCPALPRVERGAGVGRVVEDTKREGHPGSEQSTDRTFGSGRRRLHRGMGRTPRPARAGRCGNLPRSRKGLGMPG